MKRLLPWLAGIVLLGLLAGAKAVTPSRADLLADFVVRGDIGEEVTTRAFTVEVDDVETARSLVIEDVFETVTLNTSGVWLIIDATVTARLRPLSLRTTEVQLADGTRYLPSRRVGFADGLLADEQSQPEMPVDGVLIFEVPTDRLESATLHCWASGIREWRDDEAVIDLGISAADADELVDDAAARYVLGDG